MTASRSTDVEAGLVDLARALRDRVVRAHRADRDRSLAAPDHVGAGDVQYRIDRASEEGLTELIAATLPDLLPLRLLSEGLGEEGVSVGGGPLRRAERLLVIDPIDGTRGLMHDKRSAFVLVGLAADGPAPRLRDVSTAVMAEIPTTRSELSDVFSATRGRGVRGFTESLVAGTRAPLAATPSRATTLDHGFATFSRFIGGAQDRIGAVAEAFFAEMGVDPMTVFEDQYICNAGQCHALLTGRDRFIADLRPLFRDRAGRPLLCARPYDVLGAVILDEAGVPSSDLRGAPLDCPLDLVTPVGFVAACNQALFARAARAIEKALASAGG